MNCHCTDISDYYVTPEYSVACLTPCLCKRGQMSSLVALRGPGREHGDKQLILNLIVTFS